MLDSVMPASFEDCEKTGDVALGVRVWMGERIAHTSLCRKVNDTARFVTLEQSRDGGGIADVDADELESLELPQPFQPGMLQSGIVVIVQIIDPGHALAPFEEAFRNVKTDEAGGPGDKDQSVKPAFLPSSKNIFTVSSE